MQGGYQKRAQADDTPKRLLDPVTSTCEHHPGCGYQVLKTFIDKSKTRAKACKFGSGFADQVDVSKSLGDIGRIEKGTRKQKTYFFTLKLPARAEQMLSGEKAISDNPYDNSMYAREESSTNCLFSLYCGLKCIYKGGNKRLTELAGLEYRKQEPGRLAQSS